MKALAIFFAAFEALCIFLGYNIVTMIPRCVMSDLTEYEFTLSNADAWTTFNQCVGWFGIIFMAVACVVNAIVLPLMIKRAWRGEL